MSIEDRIKLESDTMDFIAEQVSAGYYSGMFDIEGNDGEYHAVSWSLSVDIEELTSKNEEEN